ncbi:tRNA synthetase class I family protein [Raphanus sativus]|nr:tRNA synthetase class I family protein [Raphanus sativus]
MHWLDVDVEAGYDWRIGTRVRRRNYKLRNWLFAGQRYWGEPIPILFLDESGETIAVKESELPLTLPELNDFTLTGTGEPPLSKAVSWVNTEDPATGKPAKRETSTMPQWAVSCCFRPKLQLGVLNMRTIFLASSAGRQRMV